MRVGFGVDAHRFAAEPGGERPLRLLGVVLVTDRSLEGTSDADVAAHAVADALLGAAALGDLGLHFPPSDPELEGADSMLMLGRVAAMVRDAGHEIAGVDVTVIAQSVRVSPHRDDMRSKLANVLAVGVDDVSVKATTTDGMGFTGREEGIAATAVALLS